jgi:hypothetical protein
MEENRFVIRCSPFNYHYFMKDPRKIEKEMIRAFDLPENTKVSLVSDDKIPEDRLVTYMNGDFFGHIELQDETPEADKTLQ